MLTSGLVAGTVLHDLLSEDWNARFRQCAALPSVLEGSIGDRQFTECMAPVERRRVVLALVTAALVLLAAVMVVCLRPRWHERHARLRPIGNSYAGGLPPTARFQQQVAE
jgi:hypothetical protein